MYQGIALIPLALTGLRLLLAPVMLLLGFYLPSNSAFTICLAAAFLSDVFDGIIARRLHVVTPALRRFDSIADSIFYVACLLTAWHLYPNELRRHAIALSGLILLEIARFAFDLVKFKRQAAYHMYSSKLWGVALFAAFVALLGFAKGGLWIDAAIYLGIIADLEGLAISWLLYTPRTDVPTLFSALRFRAAERPPSDRPT